MMPLERTHWPNSECHPGRLEDQKKQDNEENPDKDCISFQDIFVVNFVIFEN